MSIEHADNIDEELTLKQFVAELLARVDGVTEDEVEAFLRNRVPDDRREDARVLTSMHPFWVVFDRMPEKEKHAVLEFVRAERARGNGIVPGFHDMEAIIAYYKNFTGWGQ